MLLRPAAFLRSYTGLYEQSWLDAARPYRRFTYEVMKVWEVPPERFLAGVGTMPLAPISAVSESDIPEVLKQMKTRIRRKVSRSLIEQIWTSTCMLLGLRYESEVILPLIEGVFGMEESTTYQAIIQRGEQSSAIKELQKVLLRQGELRYQLAPGRKALKVLMAINDLGSLEQLAERVLTTTTWEELLGLPESKR